MPCYHPLEAFQTASGDVVFSELGRHGDIVRTLALPCGQCVGCRLERSRRWAVRCVHESQMHKHNCFVTLTYSSDDQLSLCYRHVQLFLKRLRRRWRTKVRFFCAGEYGENLARPHYHLCLFGIQFPDLVLHSRRDGIRLYRSAILEDLWPHGFSSVGELTFESAAYAARYIVDKINGDAAVDHYRHVDVDGVVTQLEPEFCHMSLKPGIGFTWLQKYHSDVYPDGKVVMRGKLSNSPRYYDEKFWKLDPDVMDQLYADRELEGFLRSADSTPDRLKVREHVARARLALKKRNSF